jgi:mRNA-degrading endonuclease RelE of RelBE toxin-antitoxin system
MKHQAHPDFWFHYRHLPESIQALADKNFELLKANPRHPSLQLKKVAADIYSARVGLDYRALAFDMGEHLVLDRATRSV